MVQPATSPPTSPAPFTVDWIVRQVTLLLTDQAYFHYFAALLLLGEAVLSFLIINFIPCQSCLRYTSSVGRTRRPGEEPQRSQLFRRNMLWKAVETNGGWQWDEKLVQWLGGLSCTTHDTARKVAS